MRKHFIFLLAIAIFLVPQFALAKSKIKLAEEYAFIGEERLAINSLTDAIKENPMNAGIHYRGAIIYLQFNDQRRFKKEVKNACKLEQSYCSKGSELYEEFGFKSISERRSSKIITDFFYEAINIRPSLKSKIQNRLFIDGKLCLRIGDLSRADTNFTILNQFDRSYGKQISKLYLNMSSNFSAQGVIFSLNRAVFFDNSHKQEVGNIAAKNAKKDNYTKKEKLSFKSLAKKYLSKKEYFVYYPPPTWHQVGKTKTFTGKGMGEKQYVKTIFYGTDFTVDDKIVVTPLSKPIRVYMRNNWNLTSTPFSEVMKHGKNGNAIGVKAPKGVKFNTKVYRLQ